MLLSQCKVMSEITILMKANAFWEKQKEIQWFGFVCYKFLRTILVLEKCRKAILKRSIILIRGLCDSVLQMDSPSFISPCLPDTKDVHVPPGLLRTRDRTVDGVEAFVRAEMDTKQRTLLDFWVCRNPAGLDKLLGRIRALQLPQSISLLHEIINVRRLTVWAMRFMRPR